MADVITKLQLENASTDANSFADFINGDELTNIVTRLGRQYPTLAALAKLVRDTPVEFTSGANYATVADAQAAVTAGTIANGAAFPVKSEEDEFIFDMFFNNNGTVAPLLASNGYQKKSVSQVYIDNLSATINQLTANLDGFYTSESEDGALYIADSTGRVCLKIETNGDKLFYGKTSSETMTITTDLIFAGGAVQRMEDSITESSEASPFWWGVGDKDGKIAIGIRKSDNAIIIDGKEYNSDSGGGSGLKKNDGFHIGDSIVENGRSVGNSYNARCWGAHAMLISKGLYRFSGQSATGGYTVTQVLNTHLPVAIAAQPTFCVVFCGRNDINTNVDVNAITIPAFKSIFEQLSENGITPVICTMAAQGKDSSENSEAQKLSYATVNEFLRTYAEENNLPFVDMATPTTDPLTDKWYEGYSVDVSHPNPVGCKVMGQALADSIEKWLNPIKPRLAFKISTPSNSDNKLENPIFVESAIGTLPTGWTLDLGAPENAVVVDDTDFLGNGFRLGTAVNSSTAHKTISVTAGDKMAFSLRAKASFTGDPEGTNAAGVSFFVVSGNDVAATTGFLAGVRTWKSSIEDGVFYYEFTVPSGVTQVTIGLTAVNSILTVGQCGLFEISTL